MKLKVILFLCFLISFNVFIVKSQEHCDHKSILISFLKKISKKNYYPSYEDYDLYFDSHSEVEIGLRNENKSNLSNSVDLKKVKDKSLAIEHLLLDSAVSSMVNKYNKNKSCNWKIVKQYKKGTASIIYVVGIDCSKKTIKFQMVNWPYKDRCGIYDVFYSNDKSIFFW